MIQRESAEIPLLGEIKGSETKQEEEALSEIGKLFGLSDQKEPWFMMVETKA